MLKFPSKFSHDLSHHLNKIYYDISLKFTLGMLILTKQHLMFITIRIAFKRYSKLFADIAIHFHYYIKKGFLVV